MFRRINAYNNQAPPLPRQVSFTRKFHHQIVIKRSLGSPLPARRFPTRLLPMVSAQELQELAEDINVRGQLTPILTYQAAILDGRNRWVACRMAGVDPETIEYKEADPVGFIKSLNILRRHLTTVERALVCCAEI